MTDDSFLGSTIVWVVDHPEAIHMSESRHLADLPGAARCAPMTRHSHEARYVTDRAGFLPGCFLRPYEIDPNLAELCEKLDQLFDRPDEAIEAPDNKRC